MIKNLSLLFLLLFLFPLSTRAYSPLKDTLMYRCQNAAWALGGFDEYYVEVSIDKVSVTEEALFEFFQFTESSLKVKSSREINHRTHLVVRAENLVDWDVVAVELEEFLKLDGFYGNCHLDL
ncbi:MAG: hypothetical protein CME63_13310 [Halobacteriovoraceae bacterium]|nr:hypothetical protein [Halobacteriovoraceae bacterium]